MRVFVRLRETPALHKELAHRLADLERKIESHDTSIRTLFDAIRKLAAPPAKAPGEFSRQRRQRAVPSEKKMTMPNEFTHGGFLSHSGKDKAIMRPVAERLRAEGLKVWFDEWEIAKVQDARRKTVSELPPSAFSLQPFLEHGLEHSKFGFRISDFGFAQPSLSANAFGSDWTQLEAGAFRFRDPLNQERCFIPLRLEDTSIPNAPARFHHRDARRRGLGLFLIRTLWYRASHDLRTVARRMEGVARPESVGAFSAQRGTVRAIPGDGRQP